MPKMSFDVEHCAFFHKRCKDIEECDILLWKFLILLNNIVHHNEKIKEWTNLNQLSVAGILICLYTIIIFLIIFLII